MTAVPLGWERRTLGEVLAVKHGLAFRGEFFGDDGAYVVVTPGNFHESGGFRPKSGPEKYYTIDPPAEFILAQGDLIVAMTEQAEGLLGSSALVPVGDYYLHNQRIGLVLLEAPELADKLFLYYLFNTRDVRAQLQATATGSKVRHTAPSRIEDVEVLLPPLQTQQLIGSVLSAYDELIENNTRRIQILEELAQAIYREWFVQFRFPGHDRVPLVDTDFGSLPMGWLAARLRDVAELAYGKALKATDRRGGSVAVYGSGGVVGWHDEALAVGPGVVIGRKGNVGSVYWSDGPFFPIDTTYYVKTRFPLTFMYFALRDLKFIDSHAAVPGLSRDQAYGLPLIVPSAEVCSRFDEIISPIFELRRTLLGATKNLQATRDLLLPRLMSGEIDVSELDVQLGDTAA